jgi:hypothetical protein
VFGATLAQSRKRATLALCAIGAMTGCGGRLAAFTTAEGGAPHGLPEADAEGAAAPDAAVLCPADVIYLAVSANPALDAAATVLETYSPATGAITPLGPPLDCQNAYPGGTVTALAVDRAGAVYVCMDNSAILRLNLATMACERTSATPTWGQPWGFAFASQAGATERLFGVFRDVDADQGFSDTFGVLDLDAGTARTIALAPVMSGLAGSADGAAFGLSTVGPLTDLVRVDVTNGSVTAEATLTAPGGYAFFQNRSQPLAFWGGDIFTFPWQIVSVDAVSLSGVLRVRPSDASMVSITPLDVRVLAANASSCNAP